MNVKFAVAFVLLLEITILCAHKIEADVHLLVLKENKKSCNNWEIGVDQHCQACEKSLDKFLGPTHDAGVTLYRSFISYITKLKSLTKSDSKILQSKTISILETLSLLHAVGTSPSLIISEFGKVVIPVAASYREIVSSLSENIGDLVNMVNEVISNLECSLNQVIKEFERSNVSQLIGSNQIDYEPVLKNVQALANTIALIADTTLNNCELNTDNVRESIFVLTLILVHFLIMTHGTTLSIEAVQYASSLEVSNSLHTCLVSVDFLLGGMADSIDVMKDNSAESITAILTSLVNLTLILNKALNGVLGLVVGVTTTVAQITQNLSSPVPIITKGLTNFLSGLSKKSLK